MENWDIKFLDEDILKKTLLPDEVCQVCGVELFSRKSRNVGLCSDCDRNRRRRKRPSYLDNFKNKKKINISISDIIDKEYGRNITLQTYCEIYINTGHITITNRLRYLNVHVNK